MRLTRFLASPARRHGGALGADLIPLVNRLQEISAITQTKVLDLPQIVVVGSQSSGKSSVVDALVGHDLLPRGRGIVTRVPLILQLQQHEEGSGAGEFAEFLNEGPARGRKLTDFRAVKGFIASETDRLAGSQKGVVDKPILLKVWKEHTLPLTLVDTPGLTRVAVADQPVNIGAEISRLCSNYIGSNSIILAVSPANQDIATSEALNFARMHDPHGDRTISVVTKVDLVDRGADVADVLSNQVLHLRLGHVGVVNRSQADVDRGVSIESAIEREKEFFERPDGPYSSMSHLHGIEYLRRTCSASLTSHIRTKLPELKRSINQQISETRSQLSRIGEAPPPKESNQRGYLMLRLITSFSDAFARALDGSVREGRAGEESTMLNGGARIRYIFNDVYSTKLSEIDPLEGLTSDTYRSAIRNASGAKSTLFLPEEAFYSLAKRQVRKLEAPALECAELVFEELRRQTESLHAEGLSQFEPLERRLLQETHALLRQNLEPTKTLIEKMVRAQSSYINHPDFNALEIMQNAQNEDMQSQAGYSSPSNASSSRSPSPGGSGLGILSRLFGGSGDRDTQSAGGATSSSSMHGPPPPGQILQHQRATDREMFQVELLKKLLRKYWDVTLKTSQDMSIKLIWTYLVENSKHDMQQHLMARLYQEEQFNKLLVERRDVSQKRERLHKRLEALSRSKEEISMASL